MTMTQAIRDLAERTDWDQLVDTGAETATLAYLYDETIDDGRDYSVQHNGIYEVTEQGYLVSVPILRLAK